MKLQPIRWFDAGRWRFQSAIVPAWLFWVVTCAFAVIAGVGVAYVGSPDSGTPLEMSTAARHTQISGGGPAGRDADRDPVVARPPEIDSEADEPPAAEPLGLAGFRGTAVQVLNATTEAGAAATLASRLETEGFAIEIVDTARRIYQRTTVFWTPTEGRAAARALADHFGWRAAPKPGNLTDSIPVHVVVGEDEV